ncbi:MAG: two pore domain potassium channel family protein, partial [Methylococcales bacterium]|nr:two pore domain potassium channel family protein [Methylococcales bacterium]
LLISLVLFFIIYPMLEQSVIAARVLNLFFLWILLSGVYAIANTRGPLIFSLTLVVLTTVLRWADHFYKINALSILEYSCNFILFAFIGVHVLRFILRQRIITAELIYAGLSVYLIFGMAWASIYHVIDMWKPGSFILSNPDVPRQDFFQMWYFSMVTLTTLGYGDIAPASMVARVFVVLEAIMGQFYLAILIASLVGRNIAQQSDETPPSET